MKISKNSFTVVLLGLVALFGAIAVPRAMAQDGKPIDLQSSEKPKWEYRVLIPNEEGPDKHEERRRVLETQLRDVGQDGWELVQMPYLKGIRYQVMVFKRAAR